MTQIKQKTLEYILKRLKGVKRSSNGQYVALCPCHDDHKPSLSVTLGDDGKILLYCHAGCPTESIVEKLDLKMSDLFPNGGERKPTSKQRIVRTYDYVDEQGNLIFQTVRFEPKSFAQRRPDGKGGWKWNLQGVRRALYHLPDLAKTQPDDLVFVCEGEKSADAIRDLGVVATCNPMGAGKWRPEYSETLRNKRVTILPDNDEAGREHARQVADALFGIAADVRILMLPSLNDKEDPFDWVQCGGTRDQLLELAPNAPPLAIPTCSPDRSQTSRSPDVALPAHTVNDTQEATPEPPDPELRQKVLRALLGGIEGAKGRIGRLPALVRRLNAGQLVQEWLKERGGFVHSENGDLYYYYASERRLVRLDSALFEAWLHLLTGVNPAGADFAHLLADCRTAAIHMPKRKVVRVAYWDAADQVLRISRFDGTVHVLDGETIATESNGEHVLFDDDPAWQPYEPAFDDPGALIWSTSELPNWESDDIYGLAWRAWVLATFFCELCPTRPMAVFLGEKDSGKSMTLRIMLRLLFGPTAEISGVPDKPDGFTAAAAAAHILAIDNLDQLTGWLRDKLARISTGAEDYYRRLYTSNERGQVTYRCWLAFTARTPDTLKRDDLADRLLILPVKRIENGQRLKEIDAYKQTEEKRGQWWGATLTALNAAVSSIRRGKLAGTSQLRMADWEALGRVFAQNEDRLETWNRFVKNLKRSQSSFLLEGDLIVEGLDLWLQNTRNHRREVSTHELHAELTPLLFQSKQPPSDWPKSTVGFGKRLASVRRALQSLYHVEWRTDHARKLLYTFGTLRDGEDGEDVKIDPNICPKSEVSGPPQEDENVWKESETIPLSSPPSPFFLPANWSRTILICLEHGRVVELDKPESCWPCSNLACSGHCLTFFEIKLDAHTN